MKTKINVLEINDATSLKGQNYWKVTTQMGSISVWKADLVAILSGFLGKECEVEIQETGKYKSIIAVHGVPSGITVPINVPVELTFYSQKDKLIVAQVAFKLALEFPDGKTETHDYANWIYKGILELSKT